MPILICVKNTHLASSHIEIVLKTLCLNYCVSIETISVEPYLDGHQGAQVAALTKEMQRRLEERRELDPEYPQRLIDQQAELQGKI